MPDTLLVPQGDQNEDREPAADSNTVAPVTDAPPDTRPPRGAMIVIAVGLVACLLAALLTADKSSGSAAQLEWVQRMPLPDSGSTSVPGGGGQMQLTEAGIRATGVNTSGYSLYRAAAVLRIDAGSPVGGARVLCSMQAPARTEVAQTPGSRATYPRSSEELIKQGVPEVVLVEFASNGTDLAVVEFGDAFAIGDNEESFASERGIKLEWPAYRVGREQWEWFLPPGPPSEPLELGFASIWKTTAIPAARIACTLTTSAGRGTVRTAGALPGRSEPINEDE
jgi:hypothetical protein